VMLPLVLHLFWKEQSLSWEGPCFWMSYWGRGESILFL
jgi:hypothetical protein